ncbi:MAG: biopolymer transporter ExbD [Planctomycetota bacterium]
MAHRKQPPEDASINLTPMIDVVFLLIIFFMVASKFSEAEGRVDVSVIADGKVQAIARQPDKRVVSADAQGNLALDGVPMTMEQMQQTLRAQVSEYPDLRVAVGGAEMLPTGKYLEILRTVKRVGVQHIGAAEY